MNMILYSYHFKRLESPLKNITIFLQFIFCINSGGVVLSAYRINNLFLSHIYFVGQFILLSLFYKKLEFNKKQLLYLNYSLVIIPLVLILQYIIFPHCIFKFNEIEVIICNFTLILFSLFHFYNCIGEKTKYFYLNSGILIYLSFNTIIFSTGNLMVHIGAKVNKYVWIFNSMIGLMFQILILIEWYKNQKRIESDSFYED